MSKKLNYALMAFAVLVLCVASVAAVIAVDFAREAPEAQAVCDDVESLAQLPKAESDEAKIVRGNSAELEAGGSCLFEIEKAAGVYTLAVAEGTIEKVYTYDFGATLAVSAARSVDAYLSGKYLVLVKNDGSETAEVELSSDEVTRSWSDGAAYAVDGQNYVYFRFTPQVTAKYVFSLVSDADVTYSLIVDGVTIRPSIQDRNELTLPRLFEGKTYYIGVLSSQNATLKSTITQKDAVGIWKVMGENGWEEIDDVFAAVRGRRYEFSYWVDGVQVEEIRRDIKPLPNGALYVPADERVGTTYVLCGVESEMTNYSQFLTVSVVPDVQNDFRFEGVNYENAVAPLLQLADDVASVQLEISAKSFDGKSYSDVVTVSSSSYDFMKWLADRKAVSATVKMTAGRMAGSSKQYALDASEKLDLFYSNVETTGSLFQSTTYYVANALQFNNLRYEQANDISIQNDIDLGVYPEWTPIPELNVIVSGKLHIISNTKITVDVDGTYFGIFGVMNAGMSNIIFSDITVKSNGVLNNSSDIFVGVVAGDMRSGMWFVNSENCTIDVQSAHSAVGGIVGRVAEGGIMSICVAGTESMPNVISGRGDVGGIAGQVFGETLGVVATHTTIDYTVASPAMSVGGAIGHAQGKIDAEAKFVNIVVTSVAAADEHPSAGYVVGSAYHATIDLVKSESCSYSLGALKNTDRCFKEKDGNVGHID